MPKQKLMAHRKRCRADDTQSNTSAKRARNSYLRPQNHPPEFWDSLSRVYLTPRALRELERRNQVSEAKNRASKPADSSRFLRRRGPLTRGTSRELERRNNSARLCVSKTKAFASEIVKFARRGGPDITDIRGFPTPEKLAALMGPPSSSKRTSKSYRVRQIGEIGESSHTTATNDVPKTVRSSAYDANFEQHYIENGVYPVNHVYGDRAKPKPSNFPEIRTAMAASRASLSPSRFTDEDFDRFIAKNDTISEGTVMRTVIPMITGDYNIPNEGHMPFTNLASMTEEATVKPIPDFWDGARTNDLHKTIRNHTDLSRKIIPTKHPSNPVVPNFFLEAKAPRGGVDVARRQAMANGAYGARGIHSLQNHLTEPIYDGNAYTYSSTYHSGNLKLYSHHISAPAAKGEPPKYHMTQLSGYDMTNSGDSYREATAALRNLRDLAQKQRDQHIQAANARATATSSDHIRKSVSRSEVPQLDHSPSHNTDYSTFNYTSVQDDQQGGNPISTSFASTHEAVTSGTTSFTSSDNPVESRSKRMSSRSPPSASNRAKILASSEQKKRPRTSREPDKEEAAVPSQPTRRSGRGHSHSHSHGHGQARATPNEYWTWSNTVEDWYHVNEDGSCEWHRAP